MNDALLSSKKTDWCTPQDFFDELDREFHFTIDVAATKNSAKCKEFFTIEDDALSRGWGGHTAFCNPPYGKDIGKWVEKAYIESQCNDMTVVMLIPARTDTKYFHDYVFRHASEIRFLRGRLVFEHEDGTKLSSAPFPSCVVVFRRDERKQYRFAKF